MALYKSSPVGIKSSAETVFNKLSDFSNLKSLMEKVPESSIPTDKKEMFDSVKVTSDSISFPAGPVGDVTLKVTEKLPPELIKLEGVNTPVAISLSLLISPVSAESCEAMVEIDIAIPAMLKPMIGGTIQKMTDQFSQVLGALKFN